MTKLDWDKDRKRRQRRPVGQVFKARFAGKCEHCRSLFPKGTPIKASPTLVGYVHAYGCPPT